MESRRERTAGQTMCVLLLQSEDSNTAGGSLNPACDSGACQKLVQERIITVKFEG